MKCKEPTEVILDRCIPNLDITDKERLKIFLV